MAARATPEVQRIRQAREQRAAALAWRRQVMAIEEREAATRQREEFQRLLQEDKANRLGRLGALAGK